MVRLYYCSKYLLSFPVVELHIHALLKSVSVMIHEQKIHAPPLNRTFKNHCMASAMLSFSCAMIHLLKVCFTILEMGVRAQTCSQPMMSIYNNFKVNLIGNQYDFLVIKWQIQDTHYLIKVNVIWLKIFRVSANFPHPCIKQLFVSLNSLLFKNENIWIFLWVYLWPQCTVTNTQCCHHYFLSIFEIVLFFSSLAQKLFLHFLSRWGFKFLTSMNFYFLCIEIQSLYKFGFLEVVKILWFIYFICVL